MSSAGKQGNFSPNNLKINKACFIFCIEIYILKQKQRHEHANITNTSGRGFSLRAALISLRLTTSHQRLHTAQVCVFSV